MHAEISVHTIKLASAGPMGEDLFKYANPKKFFSDDCKFFALQDIHDAVVFSERREL